MSLARLLQLASPSLPVGAYSYSQGLEAAAEAGIVTDAASAERWIGDALELSLARMEIPVLWRMIHDPAAAQHWNSVLLASRETAELRAETTQMGYSLDSLLNELGAGTAALDEPAYPAAYAHAVRAWGIEPRAALQGYAWAWLESQVMAAVRALPLGQTEGQRMLLNLGNRLPEILERAVSLADDELANLAPGLAFLSARHETQYSRLFRS
jgi:urease accessory protein